MWCVSYPQVHPAAYATKQVLPLLTYAPAPRRSMYDPDEIEEEQAEREKRNKINNEFSAFVKRVQELWERDFSDISLEFDVPFRELAFEGVPHRSTVKMLPTVNCLVGGLVQGDCECLRCHGAHEGPGV